MSQLKKTLALIIMDGWGYREETKNNAIANANTPVLDNLWQEQTSTLISGSGLDVGLPDGQMGNSEVGHVNLGAGRVVYQDFTRITKAIEDAEEISPIPVAKKIKLTEDTNEKLYQLATAIDALSKRVTASNALLKSASEKLKKR